MNSILRRSAIALAVETLFTFFIVGYALRAGFAPMTITIIAVTGSALSGALLMGTGFAFVEVRREEMTRKMEINLGKTLSSYPNSSTRHNKPVIVVSADNDNQYVALAV